jgi:hypothetical protein
MTMIAYAFLQYRRLKTARRGECGVRRHQTRRASQPCLMRVDGSDQQVLLLELHHLAELIGLAGLALANDLGRKLKQAEQLAFTAGVAAKHACLGLFHYLLDADFILSSSWRRPSSTSCFKAVFARFTPWVISSEKRLACPTTRLVVSNN